ERDEDTGLCMTGPRTYDPVSGRFLQGDPLSSKKPHVSPSSYCSGNPVSRQDGNGYDDGVGPPPSTPTAISGLADTGAVALGTGTPDTGSDPEFHTFPGPPPPPRTDISVLIDTNGLAGGYVTWGAGFDEYIRADDIQSPALRLGESLEPGTTIGY